MPIWNLVAEDKYERDFKQYEKKHPHELQSVLWNLDKYFTALNHLGNPRQIQAGYIHKEPHGMVALDQKGGQKKLKLQETRLYIYPDCDEKNVYLLAIGNKNTQKEDIKFCSQFIKEHLASKEKS